MTNILIGKTITKVQIAEDKKAIKFTLADGRDVVAKVDGDCCSSSWIENVNLPQLPATVTKAEDADYHSENDGEEKYYSFKISTDKGFLDIEYRNSSNGYYGGNIWFPDEDPEAYNYFYGGVHGQNDSDEKWKDITQ